MPSGGHALTSHASSEHARLASLAAAISLAACGADATGKCGAYTDSAGTLTVTAVAAAPATEYNCAKDPVAVTFSFAPSDPAQAALTASDARLTIGSGQNPPSAWVTSSGLTVGSTHPAVRSDQATGACTPVVYRVSDLDIAAGLAACY
jgi:hypothetical protein